MEWKEAERIVINVLKRTIDNNEIIIEDASLNKEVLDKLRAESAACAKFINKLEESK